ncbi:MAG: 2-oxoacid:acceptor oxidoreductase family protein, partial [Lachnospiraceae bacterium]|nr:2-oxoacid:acceptor oxidoreductase family protein [Lachnospiraceae bacterium]
PENILENLSKEIKVYSIDAMGEALKLKNSKVFNIIVLGLAAKHMDFTKEEWLKVIEETVPPKTIDINKEAFIKGFEF